MAISDAIIQRLVAHGIDTVFGIPGTQTLPLNEALESASEVEYVMARHETAVSHQAWGYGQTGEGMAATLVVPGPGDMNAMNGLMNALKDCTPLLHLSIETDPDERGGDSIHETPPDTYDNVVKENVVVETSESTLAEVDHAIETAKRPPKGPVRLGIPRNFLDADAENAAKSGSISTDTMETVPRDGLDDVADALKSARRPVIVAGGGIRAGGASEQLYSVAERLSAPVFVTTKGKGVFPEDHELFAGVLWGAASHPVRNCLREADRTLAVGTDLDSVTTDSWSIPLPGLLHVTLEPDEIGGHRNGYTPELSVVADAGPALSYLSSQLPEDGEVESDRSAAVRAAEAERLEPLRESTSPPLNSVAALSAIREGLPRESIVTADAGGSRLWTVLTFDVYEPDGYVNPGSWASMGTGFPAAIGAQVANPDRPVVSLVGDGGLMMCIHELHTIVSEDIPVVIVVFNNADYAIISENGASEHDLPDHTYGWPENPIEFVTVADGVGLPTYAAESPDEISEVVSLAVATDEPALIEIPTDPLEPQAASWMRDSSVE
jgi:acetolactate synthase-1/2/3 large subunit